MNELWFVGDELASIREEEKQTLRYGLDFPPIDFSGVVYTVATKSMEGIIWCNYMINWEKKKGYMLTPKHPKHTYPTEQQKAKARELIK